MDASILNALAEPSRLLIVELLRGAELTIGEIAEKLGLRQPQASKHVKVLNDAGIVDVRKDANRRICTLRPEPFMAMDVWLESYREVWEQRYDNLDDYLQKLQSADKNKL
ncbi:ArsR/SmtB family transcription factor [Paenibacillus sp. NPDC058071]|uniref:ArsR/SmtB family transcription factor n=1 Tax=Paenibacillus sp. NPDC058071 TaxID=3346326 RepID=UPI0036DC1FCE